MNFHASRRVFVREWNKPVWRKRWGPLGIWPVRPKQQVRPNLCLAQWPPASLCSSVSSWLFQWQGVSLWICWWRLVKPPPTLVFSMYLAFMGIMLGDVSHWDLHGEDLRKLPPHLSFSAFLGDKTKNVETKCPMAWWTRTWLLLNSN